MKTECLLPVCAAALGAYFWASAAGAMPPQPLVQVTSNQPPTWVSYTNEEEETEPGHTVRVAFEAEDPEQQPLTYNVDSLPPGASVEWRRQEVTRSDKAKIIQWAPTVVWKPKDDQIGSYDVVVSVSDGQERITRTVHVRVQEEEWESFMMPGVSYTVYRPAAHKDMGTFMGPSAEFLIGAWIHRNENRGPSHGRVYASIGLLSSTKDEVRKMVMPSLGLDLSVERNPQRSFLIPFFGLETGSVIQSDIGGPWYVMPFVGAHLWSNRNLFLHASGGYLFPTRKVDEVRGYVGRIGLDFSLW